jgi:hypothetical protein
MRLNSPANRHAAGQAEAAGSAAKIPAQLLMEREMRVTYAAVPHSLLGGPLAEARWQMAGDRFLLRGEGDHYFHYCFGAGVTIERGANADISQESLWLNGSVYAAVASLNGLLPIHASAVAHEGSVFAFSGAAGSGKSTLVAALGGKGLPMFCDDTLVLDLSDPERILCLPGHKRLKLRPDSIDLTGTAKEEKVSQSYDKYYAAPAAGTVAIALPLAELIFLEDGSEMAITLMPASERLVRTADDHQNWLLFETASRFDRVGEFGHRVRVAHQVRMAKFARPLDRSRFDESVALAAQYVKESAAR